MIARFSALVLCLLLSPFVAEAGQPIRLAEDPSITPNGKQLVFSWIGEIWIAKIDGSGLRRLTINDANDSQPLVSPDGKRVAFVSDRTGSSQIFVMKLDGSDLTQLTFHSEGYELSDWFPDGKHLLALGSRDHYHRDSTRLLKVSATERKKEQVLADAMAEDARVSPNGTKILFTREGERWWRKGYEGERSAQVWVYDLEKKKFDELLHEGVECMWPIWMPDSKGFYFTKGTLKGFELWRYRFGAKDKPGQQTKVYGFEDDSIVFPSISRNGSTILFRHLFDLYTIQPKPDAQPTKVELAVGKGVDMPKDEMRREFSSAEEAAFTKDGLEVAFIAGGDVWVMDTKLREPKRVTSTAGYEEDVLFSRDGNEIWFTSTTDGQVDIWKATRKDAGKYWWQNDEFQLEQVTSDGHVEGGMEFTQDGKQLVFQQGRGDLVVFDVEKSEKRKLISGFSGIEFDISSDGHWLAYSQQDNNFNREIWLRRLDGSDEPVNVSRHPDNESNPRFSPDGKILAFTGRRIDREVDIYYVYLQEEFGEETSRQRTMQEAIELMKKKRKSPPKEETKAKPEPAEEKKAEEAKSSDEKPDVKGEKKAKEEDSKEEKKEEAKPEKKSGFTFDLDGIHNRLRRISIPDSYESGLLFSPDSKKLAFSASIRGQRGWYTVEFPDKLTPKLLTSSTGSSPVWSKDAGGILCLRSGTPAKIDLSGKVESYSFEVAQISSRSGWLQAGFDKAWLTMREVWYDSRYANHNWDEIRRKYAPVAGEMHDTAGMAGVIYLMLGELNGSHLGFYPSGSRPSAGVEGWRDTTAHLGVRFDAGFRGPGLLVRDVIKNGPADLEVSKLQAGDVILSIDGTAVDPGLDLTTVLNGRLDRDIKLQIRRGEGDDANESSVTLRPTTYGRARSLLYEHWLERNREAVEEQSDGKLGYLHIRLMDMTSFYEFERQLYNVGYGKEGLVIDVRDNGGGSTTDILLTALTQPRHAITVPRGGGQGYPQDRAIFASWSKPIIVLCNQNSYSNAEIFSHAIKTLGRGKVVGVQTAGGVVSTGSATINDVGRIRVPFRGWFLINDGQDMERNGCKPHVTVWPAPGELPSGVDKQLAKAVSMLLKDVGEGSKDKELIYAAERDLKAKE